MMQQDPWDLLPSDQRATFAAQIQVYASERLRKLLATATNNTYYFSIWQRGVLHPFGQMPDLPTQEPCLGGLANDSEIFVLVPASLVKVRRTAWLECLTRKEMTHLHLATDDPASVQAYSERAWQEFLLDPNPRPHIACEADAQARQVSYWLSLLKHRAQSISE